MIETRPSYGGLEISRAEIVRTDLDAATRALGGRHERLSGALDEIMRLAEHLKHLDRRVSDLREPLDDELSAHRQEHGELIIVRALLEQTNERLADTRERERRLTGRVEGLELSVEDYRVAQQTQQQRADDMALAIDRLTAELNEARARGGESVAELRDANARVKQLEEDIAVLHRQAQEDEAFRREIDALLARASQDASVLEEENATLRRQIAQASAETLRLSSLETELQAQLVKERARLEPAHAAVERAQAEFLQLRAASEEQLLASRSEAQTLAARLETATARADRLEALNAETGRRLSEAKAKHRADERRLGEMNVGVDRSDERAAALEAELNVQRNANLAVERARLAALDRADQLGKVLQSHELTIRRAEERLRDMQLRLEASAAAQDAMKLAQEQESGAAASELERLRADLAIAEAGLQSAHDERARSHRVTLNGGPKPTVEARLFRSSGPH